MIKVGLDKNGIVQNFNAAAKTYEAVARLQKYAGTELLERLEFVRISPGTILDLGSGPGEFARLLAGKYKQGQVVEIDIAENMLGVSRAYRQHSSRRRFICGDAEQLPLAEQSVDLVYSNLMLQWVPQPDQMLRNVLNALRPAGLFIFSTLGPDTLRELRDSWTEADDTVHVNAFIDMHDLGDALIRAGFSDPVMEVESVKLSYTSLAALMGDLKQLGAHNVNSGRRRTLTGKSRFSRMQKAYEAKKENGMFPASYEIIYGHAWSPGTPKQAVKEPGLFSIPLDLVRRALKKNTGLK